MESYKGLVVYQKAYRLSLEVYRGPLVHRGSVADLQKPNGHGWAARTEGSR